MQHVKTALCVIVIALSLCGCESQVIESQADLADAQARLAAEETKLTEAQAELEDEQSDSATLEAFTQIISDLFSELGNERQSQRESLSNAMELIDQLYALLRLAVLGNLVLSGLLILVVFACAIVLVIGIARRRKPQHFIVQYPAQFQPGAGIQVIDVQPTAIAPRGLFDRVRVWNEARKVEYE